MKIFHNKIEEANPYAASSHAKVIVKEKEKKKKNFPEISNPIINPISSSIKVTRAWSLYQNSGNRERRCWNAGTACSTVRPEMATAATVATASMRS